MVCATSKQWIIQDTGTLAHRASKGSFIFDCSQEDHLLARRARVERSIGGCLMPIYQTCKFACPRGLVDVLPHPGILILSGFDDLLSLEGLAAVAQLAERCFRKAKYWFSAVSPSIAERENDWFLINSFSLRIARYRCRCCAFVAPTGIETSERIENSYSTRGPVSPLSARFYFETVSIRNARHDENAYLRQSALPHYSTLRCIQVLRRVLYKRLIDSKRHWEFVEAAPMNRVTGYTDEDAEAARSMYSTCDRAFQNWTPLLNELINLCVLKGVA